MTTEYNQKARAKAIERLGESWVLHPDYKSKKNPAHTYREGSYILKKRRKHGGQRKSSSSLHTIQNGGDRTD